MLLSVFSSSEVAQSVPPLEMVQICWLFLVERYFDSDSAITLEAMVEFVRQA